MVLAKWTRLSRHDRHLLRRAACLVVLVRLSLWALPLATVRRLANQRKFEPLKGAPPDPLRVAWAVTVASRYVPQATCLVQAIATQSLLGQLGLDSQLQVGVALDPKGQFQAHAWVEHAGQIVIGGTESERYATLLSLKQQHP